MDPLTSENKKNNNEVSGIGGWLILPLLGLLFTPVKIGYLMSTLFVPVFTEGYWEVLTSPESEAYHALWGPLIIFELVGNLFFLCFSIYLIVLFFRKNYLLPKLYIAFLISNVVFLTIDYFVSDLIPAVAMEDSSESMKELVQTIAAACIWTPYFLKSRRVKNTFVKGKRTELPTVRELQSFTRE